MGTDTANSTRELRKRKNGDHRRNTTGPSPEDFRWITNHSLRDLAPVLQALGHAANTHGRGDIARQAARLAGDALLDRPVIDMQAIKKDINREASEHGCNDFYVYDRSIELFGKLYQFCRAGYSTSVQQGKKEAAWRHGYQP